jgi:hypothetical protein
MKKIVIGITGVKTSGKSTVANILKRTLSGAKESALADKLKDVSSRVFLVPRNYFDDQELKESKLEEPRILTMTDIEQIIDSFNSLNKVTPEIREKLHEICGMELDTPRKIAQIVGTEVLRLLGEDIHCRNVELHEGITIVSDIRFPNEFNFFRNNEDLEFIPLYISRKEAESKVSSGSHSSETSVFLFKDECNKIDNDGSLTNTQAQVLSLLTNELTKLNKVIF